jgi:hypothetical protein
MQTVHDRWLSLYAQVWIDILSQDLSLKFRNLEMYDLLHSERWKNIFTTMVICTIFSVENPV